MTDRILHPCPSCQRHVADEPACPFCGAALPATSSARATLPGRFSRAAVFAGATLAGCWTNSNEPRTTPVEHRDNTDRPVDIKTKDDSHTADVARTPAHIEGTMTDSATGQPAANIQIVLTNSKTQGQATVVTAMNGHYVFDNVEPGSYTLSWGSNNPRQNRSVLQTTVAEGARLKLNLTMTFPRANNTNIPMPYGAPPARYRRV